MQYVDYDSPYTTSIHIIDDDSLLNVFISPMPVVVGDEDKFELIIVGADWVRERWWYTLARLPKMVETS